MFLPKNNTIFEKKGWVVGENVIGLDDSLLITHVVGLIGGVANNVLSGHWLVRCKRLLKPSKDPKRAKKHFA